jgi:uncharacterized protein (TIGR02284 family)
VLLEILKYDIVRDVAARGLHGMVGGSLHRTWTNIKSSITGMDEHAVLAECERGEDVAKSAYAVALGDDLPPTLKAIVLRQYQAVKENQDRIRDLRNQSSLA